MLTGATIVLTAALMTPDPLIRAEGFEIKGKNRLRAAEAYVRPNIAERNLQLDREIDV